ncbi:MAG: MarR family transcriptional regulator [Pseudomonadota bacterium]
MSQTPKYRLAEHICHQAYALDRALNRAYQTAFASTGFTYPKYIVLLALDEFGPLTIGALSAHAGVETNTLSPLLKKMAESGIVTRTRSEADERQVVIAMTEFGAAVLANAREAAAEIYAAFGLGEKEAAELAQTLSKLRDAVAEAKPSPIKIPPR